MKLWMRGNISSLAVEMFNERKKGMGLPIPLKVTSGSPLSPTMKKAYQQGSCGLLGFY
jgi:hypothetical protein